MQLFAELQKAGALHPYFDYAHGYGVPQASYFLHPEESPDTTLDLVVSTFAINVLVREEYVPNEEESADAPRIKDQVGDDEEPTDFAEEALADSMTTDSKLAREPKFNRYLYYHLQSPSGVLDRYAVLKVEQADIKQFRRLDYAPGTVLRVYYRGFVTEYVFE